MDCLLSLFNGGSQNYLIGLKSVFLLKILGNLGMRCEKENLFYLVFYWLTQHEIDKPPKWYCR